MRPSKFTRASWLALLASAPAIAGGGPENVLIIADPTSPEGLRTANTYIQARGVPAQNVLYMNPDAANYSAFTQLNLPALLGELEQRGISDHIDYILIMPGGGYRLSGQSLVSDICPGPIQNFSVTGAYSSAFIADEILSGTLNRAEPNRYAAGASVIHAFDSETTYNSGAPDTGPEARRYFIAFKLGYSGQRGNSVSQTYDMIARSVASDGTFPAGTFYLMDNSSDPARNVRRGQYNNASSAIAAAGGTAQIVPGSLPLGNQDCLGIVSGFASETLSSADFSITNGAICEQLTSFAAHFDVGQQTKVSAWITKGASGSYGTVEEPCNQTGKFPRANVHATYRSGLSLGEALFHSLFYYPFQGLCYGDPLTRPWAYIPEVSIPDAPTSPVSGLVTINPVASTSHPSAGIASLDLLVNGVLEASVAPGGSFTIDTTQLPEGINELRVLAFEDSDIKTVGSWVGTIEVDNTPHAASMSVSSMNGSLAASFDFTVAASGGSVQEVRLLHNERVIAASSAAGTLSVNGRMIGPDDPSLIGEVEFTDGVVARTEPLSVHITQAGDPTVSTPVAFSYTKALTPGAAGVVELPATFNDELADATWTIIDPPSQASILGGDGPFRVLDIPFGATGSDSMTFQVTTPSGLSAVATVTLRYAESGPCNPADVAEPFGSLDFSDALSFLIAFANQEPEADLGAPFGEWDFTDITFFLAFFGTGCP